MHYFQGSSEHRPPGGLPYDHLTYLDVFHEKNLLLQTNEFNITDNTTIYAVYQTVLE